MKTWSQSRSFLESCGHAWDGLVHVYKSEANIRRQVALGAVAIIVGIIFLLTQQIPVSHFLLIVGISGVVLMAECINAAVEVLENVVHPEYHSSIKVSKDIMAGAVLVISGTAVCIGLFVFLPPLLRIVGS